MLGPRARERLKQAVEAAQPGAGAKLERAPTLVATFARRTGEPTQDREDLLAGAVAAYIVLLGAHGRGLAGYWRTVAMLDEPAGRAAVGAEADETPIGLLHLGTARQEQRVPEREPVGAIVHYLD